MHRRAPIRSVAMLAALLAGCAETRWEHPLADPARAAGDQSECDQSASLAARQQVMFERLSGPRPVRNGVTRQYFDQCMRAKGYRLVRVE
jgi:hypothetical protein